MSKNYFQKFVTVFTLILLGLAATIAPLKKYARQ